MANANLCLTQNSQTIIAPSLYLTGKNKATFSIQAPIPSDHFWQIIPEGGIYILVAKIKAITHQKTELYIYTEKLGHAAAKTLINWSNNKMTNCQFY